MTLSIDELPLLSPLTKRGWWILREDWMFRDIIIEKNFECDLDSVPALPWIFAIFKGRSRIGALVHDHRYGKKKGKRIVADREFLEIMETIEEVAWYYRYPIYYAVRAAGWWYWYDFPERIAAFFKR